MFTGIRLPQTVFYDSVFPEVDCQYTLGSPAYRWILHACMIYVDSGLNMQKANIDSVDTIFVDVVAFDTPEYILFLADTQEFQADEVFKVQAEKVIFGNLAQNYAGGSYSFCGGDRDSAIGGWSVVNGGAYNIARGSYSVVGGGTFNIADSTLSVISGGTHGRAGAYYTGIGSGRFNTISGGATYSRIAGGDSNYIDTLASYGWVYGKFCKIDTQAIYCVIDGGLSNYCAPAVDYSKIGGGANNTIAYAADFGVIGGGRENYIDTSVSNGTVGGGINDSIFASTATVAGGNVNRALKTGSTVSGGNNNVTNGSHAVVAGGQNNYADGDYSVVGGGQYDTASADYDVVCGGYFNVASGGYSVVVSGAENRASGELSSVVSGDANVASGEYAHISSGSHNNALGSFSVVLGGDFNKVTGFMSMIGGGAYNRVVGEEAGVGWGKKDSVHTKYSYAGGAYCEVWGDPGDSASIAMGRGSIVDSAYNSVALNGVTEDADLTTGIHNSNVHYALSTQREDTALANGNNNDITCGGRSFVKITGPTGAFSITGVANGFDGKRLVIYNSVAQNMTIEYDDANSVAANRIITMTGADLVSTAAASVELIYDADASRWIVIGWRP
jgi:hypothetical protein